MKNDKSKLIIMAVYVEDLAVKLYAKDLGLLHLCLGIEFKQGKNSIYYYSIIQDYRSLATLVEINMKLTKDT